MPTFARCHLRLIAVILFLSWVAPFNSQTYGQSFTGILQNEATQFAHDPKAGTVLVVETDNKSVALYAAVSSTGIAKMKKRVSFTQSPVGATYKRYKGKGYFAVVCKQHPAVYVYHAESLELVKRIVTNEMPNGFLAVSRSDSDPAVYYQFGSGHGSSVGFVDLSTLDDRGKVEIGDSVRDMEISADGKRLYTRGPWSPTGFEVWSLMPHPTNKRGKKGVQTFREHKSVSRYLADPTGQYVLAGSDIYTADCTKKVGVLPAYPFCFFEDRPIIIGIKDARVTAMSYNTFATLGSAPSSALSATDSRGRRVTSVPSSGFAMFADTTNKRVIVCSKSLIEAIPLKTLSVKDEPFMFADVDYPDSFSVGKTYSMTVKARAPRIRVSLEKGPAGMKLVGSKLQWQPSSADVGTATITLGLAFGDTAKPQTTELPVGRSHIALEFAPAGLALDHSGEKAVAWNANTSHSRTNVPIKGSLALIDLKKGELIATKEVPEHLHLAAISNNHIATVARNASVVEILSPKDFSLMKRLVLEGVVTRMNIIQNRFLVLTSSRNVTTTIDLNTYKPLASDHIVGQLLKSSSTSSRFVRTTGQPTGPISKVQGGWRVGQYVLSEELDKIQAILPGYQFPIYRMSTPSNSTPPMNWNRRAYNATLSTADGRIKIAAIPAGTVAVSDTLAMAAIGSFASYRDASNYRNKGTLSIVSLRDGKLIASDVMFDDPRGRTSSRSAVTVATTNNVAAMTFGNRVYYRAYTQDQIANLEQPLSFSWKQSSLVADSAKPTTLVHEIQGGKKPYDISLAAASPGVSIDKIGKVTIDPKQAIPGLIKLMTSDGKMSKAQATSQWTTYQDKFAPIFKDIVGRAPKGIPMALPIHLAVRDDELRIIRPSYVVLVEVPMEQVLEGLKDAPVVARHPNDGKLGFNNQPNRPVGSVEDRVESLESRLKVMEAQMQLILNELQRQRRN